MYMSWQSKLVSPKRIYFYFFILENNYQMDNTCILMFITLKSSKNILNFRQTLKRDLTLLKL